ncbi:GAF and ANTAR domain-containing protein [Nocardioides perillae]|uniref:GAF domain-containing protein n=1 Tax=Nocardioides perillae TaxID=1119534 RepID=A0A7Y9RTT1_9ACTN|nr:GAF and ANTAR domain-containing protein [Nocardioides perillae]NYG53855.1 GAF domain-containing protein [Nocardioides perillae]
MSSTVPTSRAHATGQDQAPPVWWPLVSTFAELSQELLAEKDERAIYVLMCRRVHAVVPATELCGITMRRRRGRLESVSTSDPLAEQVDELQYTLREGPCMEAALEVDHYLAEDVATDPRWPSWGPRAAELGVRSLVSVQLPSDTLHDRHQPLGALNLYSSRVGAFGPDQLRIAQVFARHAANALAAARERSGLEQAVEARHLVGVAQGVLRQRYDLDLDTAFEVLARFSNERNVKLRDLAAQVVAERGLPDDLDAGTAAAEAADARDDRDRTGRTADGPHVPAQAPTPDPLP